MALFVLVLQTHKRSPVNLGNCRQLQGGNMSTWQAISHLLHFSVLGAGNHSAKQRKCQKYCLHCIAPQQYDVQLRPTKVHKAKHFIIQVKNDPSLNGTAGLAHTLIYSTIVPRQLNGQQGWNNTVLQLLECRSTCYGHTSRCSWLGSNLATRSASSSSSKGCVHQ